MDRCWYSDVDESGIELEEVPLCSHSFKNRYRIYTHPGEHDKKLVHEHDIDVTMVVLDDLCDFRYLMHGAMNTSFNDKLLDLCEGIKRFLIHACDNFRYRFEMVNLIAEIYTFRKVAYLKSALY